MPPVPKTQHHPPPPPRPNQPCLKRQLDGGNGLHMTDLPKSSQVQTPNQIGRSPLAQKRKKQPNMAGPRQCPRASKTQARIDATQLSMFSVYFREYICLFMLCARARVCIKILALAPEHFATSLRPYLLEMQGCIQVATPSRGALTQRRRSAPSAARPK